MMKMDNKQEQVNHKSRILSIVDYANMMLSETEVMERLEDDDVSEVINMTFDPNDHHGPVYQLEVKIDGTNYDLTIDALTGKKIKRTVKARFI